MQYVDINKLDVHPPRDHKFSPEILEIIKDIEETLKEVFPQSFEAWVDGFGCDAHPEGEIAFWSCLADKFKEAVKNYPDDTDYHKDIYTVLFLGLMRDEKNLKIREFKKLTTKEVEDILKSL